MSVKDQAVELLYQHLHAIPHEEYGVINMLPFSHDSEQVRAIKRQVCEGLAGLLDNHGLLRGEASEAAASPARTVQVKCMRNGDTIISLRTDDEGISIVNPSTFIQMVANLNPECPHAPMTLDDMRRHMQEKLDQEAAEQAGDGR